MVKLTQEEFERRFYLQHDPSEFKVVGAYTKYHEPIDILHIPCNTVFPINAAHSLDKDRTLRCPKCSNHYPITIPYVNDIYTTNPEVYELLTDKEDGYKYKAYSNKETFFTCPFCGRSHMFLISYVTSNGFSCPYCGDHCGSYAEKFIYNMLYQLGVDSKREYSPDWISPYRYDIKFNYQDSKYIVEIDGGWHYRDNPMSGQTAEEVQIADEYKQEEAIKHGFVVIRIDNNYSNNRYLHLVNAITNSDLSSILDLTKADFKECHYYASQSSKILQAASLWKSGIYNSAAISEEIGVVQGTARSYLQSACESGIIDISYEELKLINKEYTLSHNKYDHIYDEKIIELWKSGIHNFNEIANTIGVSDSTPGRAMQRNANSDLLPYSYEEILVLNRLYINEKNTERKGQPVLCNETGEIFNSFREAFDKYRARLAVYFSPSAHIKHTGKLPDGTKLTWTKLDKVAQ